MFLVVVHDLHSKWPEIAATSVMTSMTIINILSKLFDGWGLPEVIITDNSPRQQFVSYEFEMFLEYAGIEHRHTARYNSQCNLGVERLNRVIKESLPALLTDGKAFKDAVRTILQTYHSTPHALTQRTPAEMMIGRKLQYLLEALKPIQTLTANTGLASAIPETQQRVKEYTDRCRRV